MNRTPANQEPPYAKQLSRITRPFTNFDFFFVKGVREQAVCALQLSPGGQVLDLGCGGGGSFPYLERAVGSTGKIVGVDVSPQSCINARRRAKSNGWENVSVIEASAQKVALAERFDGALMFAAPDVFTSESALANILPHLKNQARVAIFGAKLSGGRLGKILNWFFSFMFRTLSPTTPVPDEAPWGLLAGQLEGLIVREYFYGSMFLAYGTLKGH
jgi:SAM-dependent methyltransferase